MKIDYRPLLFLIASIILAVMLLLGMASCSSSYHLRKFYDKGGKIQDKKTEIVIHDTLRINGKDSIIEKTIQVDCPEPKAPLTRYEIRYKYKTLHDTLKLIEYQTKWRTKERIRTLKNDVKTNPIRQIKSFIIWSVLLIIGLFVYNWISKK